MRRFPALDRLTKRPVSTLGLAAATCVAAILLTSPGEAFAQRGGWNPADMLRRADRNGDGRLEESEVDDRFKGFLERAANDAGMRGGFPYDVNRMAEAMDRARREREGDRGRDDDDRGRDRDRDDDRNRDEASKPEPLVPGFGETTELPAPLAFGDGSVFLTKEQATAQYGTRLVGMVDQMMERYDRDKSGALEQREWEGARWSSPPESSDLNKDGILTQSELYMRLKDRFSGNEEGDEGNDDRNESDGARPATPPATPAVLTNVPGAGAQGPGVGAQGSPGSQFVSRRDENGEGDENDGDPRRDRGDRGEGGPRPAASGGVISGGAPMAGGGVLVGGGPAGVTPPRIGPPGATGGQRTPGEYRRDENQDEEEEDSDEEEADRSEEQANNDRYVRFAETMIRNFDKDKNGTIEKAEWGSMTGDPGSADFNRDGKLTKEELVKRLADKYGGGDSSASASSTPSRTASSLNSNRRGVSSKDAYAASRSNAEQGARPAYRFLTPVERLPSGLPDWFLEKDKNSDAQVGMYEFASEWSDEEVEKFRKLDKNSNGFISAKEVQAGESAGEAKAEAAGEEDER